MKVLFVHQSPQTYVLKDLEILRTAHEVRPIHFTGRKNVSRSILPDLAHVWRGVLWGDVTFSWFGKLHAFFTVLFSKMLGKKAIVVSGGDDVANCSVAGKPYGLCADPVGRWFAYYTFRYADKVIAISRYNEQETISNTGVSASKVVLVPHGFDGTVFRRMPNINRAASVSTISNLNEENYHRKGLSLFVEAARLLPREEFFVVGPDGEGTGRVLLRQASANVTLTGGLYGEDLIAALSRTSVYVQASEWESFGCSVAEAMLCECVPVVSRRASLPEVVGDCGIYVDELKPDKLAEGIAGALNRTELGERARQRIIDCYPLEGRKRRLLQVVDQVSIK